MGAEPDRDRPEPKATTMKIAILGATGLVGRTMLELVADRDWVDGDPLLLATHGN